MKKTQLKDTVRGIKKTFVSWIAVAIVTMIGCGVYFGVYFYADSLEQNGKNFFDETNYEDFGIVATNGITPKEVESIREFDDVKDAEGGFYIPHSYFGIIDKETNKAKIDEVTISSVTERVSKPVLKEGNFPVKPSECALTETMMKKLNLNIGDQIGLMPAGDEMDNVLVDDEFTIVGVVEHGDAISEKSAMFAYLSLDAFDGDKTLDCFGYVHVDVEIPSNINYLSESYNNYLLPIKDRVRKQLDSMALEHDTYIQNTVTQKIIEAGESVTEEDIEKLIEAISEGETEEELTAKDKLIEEKKAEYFIKRLEKMFTTGYGIILRGEKESFATFKQDVSIIHKLAIIFIIIFLAIGVIVIFSTITIQVDNNRKYLGTMVAYGFDGTEIINKYVIYGVSAVVLGMLIAIGLAAGLQVMISSVIGPMFSVKADSFAFFWMNYGLLFLVEVGLAMIVAVIAISIHVNRVSVIDLLNGVTKQKGNKKDAKKKKSGSLYSRLIIRNMKKDKGRVITSIVVIAGSCLMMGLGLTLKGSLDKMMPASHEEVMHYDVELSMTAHYDYEYMTKLLEYLDQSGVDYETIRKDDTIYIFGDNEEYVTVVSGPEKSFSDMIELSDWEGSGSFTLGKGEAVVDNRLAERAGIKVGDTIKVFDHGYVGHDVKVTGICKNYSGRFIYLSPDIYKNVFGEEPNDVNTALVRLNGVDAAELLGDPSSSPNIKVTYTDRLPESTASVTKMFNVVVYLLIGLSILMSVFVLLNLVNIFVKRRQNELIIMDVNGFYYREQLGYMLKESLTTTVLGLILGVLGGWGMTNLVVRTVETDYAMYVRSFNWVAWLIAVGLETLFAVLIYLYAFRKIRNLNLTDITR
ncbi:MAG: hypothetical protein IKQ97_04045 [Eubacterium sp.]|nr:hypothetical protein [Eubacterium sp.]